MTASDLEQKLQKLFLAIVKKEEASKKTPSHSSLNLQCPDPVVATPVLMEIAELAMQYLMYQLCRDCVDVMVIEV